MQIEIECKQQWRNVLGGQGAWCPRHGDGTPPWGPGAKPGEPGEV